MESVLHDIPNVVVYIDDNLVTGASEEEHWEKLDCVLERLETAGLRVKEHECTFMVSSVEYLGYVIDEKGLHPTPDKVQAVKEAPSLKSVQELQAYLGLPHTTVISYQTCQLPLHILLWKDVPWQWTQS